MTFPKLSISLFPPKKPGTKYIANGSLRFTLEEAAQFAEWLLAQPGEHDDYLNQAVIRVPAFMYENQSKQGQDYHTVQLVDLDSQQRTQDRRDDRQEQRQAPARRQPAAARDEALPF
jgi:hypothetical protein